MEYIQKAMYTKALLIFFLLMAQGGGRCNQRLPLNVQGVKTLRGVFNKKMLTYFMKPHASQIHCGLSSRPAGIFPQHAVVLNCF